MNIDGWAYLFVMMALFAVSIFSQMFGFVFAYILAGAGMGVLMGLLLEMAFINEGVIINGNKKNKNRNM